MEGLAGRPEPRCRHQLMASARAVGHSLASCGWGGEGQQPCPRARHLLPRPRTSWGPCSSLCLGLLGVCRRDPGSCVCVRERECAHTWVAWGPTGRLGQSGHPRLSLECPLAVSSLLRLSLVWPPWCHLPVTVGPLHVWSRCCHFACGVGTGGGVPSVGFAAQPPAQRCLRWGRRGWA